MTGDRRRRTCAPLPDADPGDTQPGYCEVLPLDRAVEGCRGVVTIRIPGGESPGEVRVRVRGTYELFVAYTMEALNVGNRVVVDRSRGGRAVEVTSIFTETIFTET
jgi:hypothetical protein